MHPGTHQQSRLRIARIQEVYAMCRNIKILFNFDPPVTDEEIRAASLQFVRKISGFTKPSKANEEAFRACSRGSVGGFNTTSARARDHRATEKSRRGSREGQGTQRRAVRSVDRDGAWTWESK